MFAVCQLLDFANAFCLDLIQSFATRQPNIVHSFRVLNTKTGPLTTSQEQDSNTVLRDFQQPCYWEEKKKLK